MGGNGSVENGMTIGGQTLDEIINQNNEEMIRRRTYQQPQFRQNNSDHHARRASMLEFGGQMGNELADFQFDPNPTGSMLNNSIGELASAQKSHDPRKIRSRENLSVDTRFPAMDSTYGAFPGSSPYSPALMTGVSLSLDHSSQYMSQPMDLSMDYDIASGEVTPINMHSATNQQGLFVDSPLEQNYRSTYPGSIQDPGGGDARTDEQTLMDRVSHMSMPDSRHPRTSRHENPAPSPVSTSQVTNMNNIGSPTHQLQPGVRPLSGVEHPSNFSTESMFP